MLDNACTNKKYRQKLLKKLKNVILIGDCDEVITITLFEWMGRRSIYLSHVLVDENFARWRTRLRSSNKSQFKFAVKDLKCYSLEDAHILKELHLSECFNLSNASMLSIAKHCPGLQVLDLGECIINDIGIIAITRNCKGLKSLNLACSYRGLTDTGVLSIQKNCPELKELFLCYSEFISLEVMNSEYFRSRGAFRYVGVKGLLPQYESNLDGDGNDVMMMCDGDDDGDDADVNDADVNDDNDDDDDDVVMMVMMLILMMMTMMMMMMMMIIIIMMYDDDDDEDDDDDDDSIMYDDDKV